MIGDYLEEFPVRDYTTDTDRTLDIAVIGLGDFALTQAIPAITSTQRCTFSVAVSGTPATAEQVVENHGVTVLNYDEYRDGVATDEYDAVYICTPNSLHLDHGRIATSHGKDILCEKPLEATVERARQLVERCDTAGVTLMVAYRMHFEPAVYRAKEALQEGVVGDVAQVYGANTERLSKTFSDDDHWRLDPDLSGYGSSVMDIGIYPINTTRYLLEQDPIRVTSVMHSNNEAFADVPDERSMFTLVWENDVQSVFTTSLNAYKDSQLKITGTEGRINFEPAFQRWCDMIIEREGTAGEFTLSLDERFTELVNEFEYFADCILSGESVYADGKHALKDMCILRAIYRAAQTDETIEISYEI